MSAAIIDLNDHELRLAHGGKILVRSPASAIVKGNEIQIGRAAYEQAQLQPREYHNKFWYQLGQAALRKTSRFARHNADLAFRHLEHVHQSSGSHKEVVFVVAGGYSKEQLALLLGIADALDIETLALVDAAVACAAACAGPGHYYHVELQLHRAVVSELRVDDTVELTGITVIDGIGSDKLHSRFVAYVADQFLAQSRFDPLHQANTEQLLFNEMAAWLVLLRANREIKVHIDFRGSRFEARISREEFVVIAEPIYDEIRRNLPADAHCLIGDRLGTMPGFMSGCVSQWIIAESAVFDGSVTLAEAAKSSPTGLSLITRLPACATPSIFPTQPQNTGRPNLHPTAATHVLCGIRAFELSAAPLYLNADGTTNLIANARAVACVKRIGSDVSVDVVNSARLRVNGLPTSRAEISAGDEITVEGSAVIFSLINVVTRNA
jgi:hypothetical protein